MFLTFEATNKGGLRNPKPAATRRSERLNRRQRSTTRACTSCRQRKIRCDGEMPCEACRWYKKAEQCRYQEREREQREQRQQRESPADGASPDFRGALERLFPDIPPETIANMPRETLLALLSKRTTTDGPHASHPSQLHDQLTDPLTVATSASAETHASALSLERPSLEALHSIPGEQQNELDESQNASASEESDEHISDDVNALSLPARHATSYLGVSSIQAALKVIAWLHPDLHAHLTSPKERRHHQNRHPDVAPPTELQLLDAYFTNFQPFSPLVDEDACRSMFLAGRRKDDRWLALVNIMLALGSITSAGVDNDNHKTYFERSMSLLHLNVLGHPSLEVVQTLGLMGGWYCHYVSQPNLAYVLMGASLRMAVTLGLQHEPPLESSHAAMGVVRPSSGPGHQEVKRRIWWSLCCLDTWGHETLGRPNMDFFSPSITVKMPRVLNKENYTKVLPLMENSQFIKIAAKIQESLAALPTLVHAEMLRLDTQLLQWWNNVPAVLKDHTPCPDGLYAARTVMRWRLYNQRMLLYRPKLLSYAMSRIPLVAIKDEERVAVQTCRAIAKTAIEDISATTATKTSQMIAWNAVWLLFQATMVPLIFLAAAPGADNADDVEACKAQVQTAMSTLDRMRPYGHTAERSLGMVAGIFETVLHTPGAGVPTSEQRAANEDQDMASRANDQLLAEDHQPVVRERVLDWTASTAAGASGAATMFDNYSSQQMWDYLSWGESNDFWQELQLSFATPDGAEEAHFFGSRTL